MYNNCLHLCLCVCTFSVMSRSQESMLSMNRSSVLLPWLDPNTLWLAWNSWLQGGEDTLGTSSTHRGHYNPFLIMIIYRMCQLLMLLFPYLSSCSMLNPSSLTNYWPAPSFYADSLQCGSLIGRSGYSPSKCCAGNLSVGAETREKLWVTHSHRNTAFHSLFLRIQLLFLLPQLPQLQLICYC